MKVKGHEITIHRGETFTIDKRIQNKDGSPYIISDEMKHAYFLITIAPTVYSQAGTQSKKYWLEISNKFNSTNPIKLTGTSWPATLPSGYLANDGVFYIVKSNGTKEYKYWNGTSWKEYDCRIIRTFVPDDTLDLVGQSYLYSILLVSLATDDVNNPDYDSVTVILPPTKLAILSNVFGG